MRRGAGLPHQSQTSHQPQTTPCTHVSCVRQVTLGRVAAAAAAVESAMGGAAQDVEGVVAADGRVWVVQARPQV